MVAVGVRAAAKQSSVDQRTNARHETPSAGNGGARKASRVSLMSEAEVLKVASQGLWAGTLTQFSKDGNPLELPPHYVPAALKEWGKTLFDWHSLSDCTLGPSGESFKQTTKRQVPLAACEAIQTQYEVEYSLDTGDAGVCFSSFDSGWCLAPRTLHEKGTNVLHVCFDDRRCDASSSLPGRIQVRPTITSYSDGHFELQGVSMCSERKLADSTSVEMDVASGICEDGLSSKPRLERLDPWGTRFEATCLAVGPDHGGRPIECPDGSEPFRMMDDAMLDSLEGTHAPDGITLLPCGAYARMVAGREDGEGDEEGKCAFDIGVEVGVVDSEGRRSACLHAYKGGALSYIFAKVSW